MDQVLGQEEQKPSALGAVHEPGPSHETSWDELVELLREHQEAEKKRAQERKEWFDKLLTTLLKIIDKKWFHHREIIVNS